MVLSLPPVVVAIYFAVIGLVTGVIVTSWLHLSHGFWSRRVGRSRFRRANLPVGGMIAAIVALAEPSAAITLLPAAAAMAAAAVLGRYVDPLPPL